MAAGADWASFSVTSLDLHSFIDWVDGPDGPFPPRWGPPARYSHGEGGGSYGRLTLHLAGHGFPGRSE